MYSLTYDIADPANDYERYDILTVSSQTVFFSPIKALSMPAVRLSFVLPTEDSLLQPYEFLEPFIRYGIYEQELLLHRAVHGSAEFHPISEPCLVTVVVFLKFFKLKFYLEWRLLDYNSYRNKQRSLP